MEGHGGDVEDRTAPELDNVEGAKASNEESHTVDRVV